MNVLMNRSLLSVLTITGILIVSSCSPAVKLTSSWSRNTVPVKTDPKILVMALGKPDSETRKEIENRIVSKLKKDGFNAIPASAIFEPGVTKRDSAEVVNTLKKNSIDLLLMNAVISRTETERFVPGTLQSSDIVVPGGGTANPYSSYNTVAFGYHSNFNYYNYYSVYNNYNASSSYQVIEAPDQVGETITDVHIVVETNLFDVETASLMWNGLSTSYTKDPSPSQVNKFVKGVIGDIKAKKLLIK